MFNWVQNQEFTSTWKVKILWLLEFFGLLILGQDLDPDLDSET